MEVELVDGEFDPADPVAIGRLIAKLHRGPLPDAETFAAYEMVHPGAAGELLRAAKDQRGHRFAMDHTLADTARLSLVLTWTLVVGALTAAVLLGLNDKDALAALFGLGGLAPIIIGILRGRGSWTGK